MIHSRFFALAIVLILPAVIGCQPPVNQYVGKWTTDDGRIELEFFVDQTFRMHGQSDISSRGLLVAGTWMELEDGRVKMDFVFEGKVQIVTGVIEGKQLFMIFINRPFTFRRQGIDGVAESTGLQQDSRYREARLRRSCANNLRQLGLAMNMFTNDSHAEMYPPLDSTRGRFTFRIAGFVAKYLPDSDVLHCPAIRDKKAPPGIIENDHYWYLGYTMADEETGIAFLQAYEELPAGLEFPEYFNFDEDYEPGDALPIPMLRHGIERFFITDVNNTAIAGTMKSKIPLMVERPENHGEGGNVLYLDGHVEFIKYPGKFPMTEKFIKGLRRLESKGN